MRLDRSRTLDPLHTANAVYCLRGDSRSIFVRQLDFIKSFTPRGKFRVSCLFDLHLSRYEAPVNHAALGSSGEQKEKTQNLFGAPPGERVKTTKCCFYEAKSTKQGVSEAKLCHCDRDDYAT